MLSIPLWGGIPNPATFTIELGQQLSANYPDFIFRLYSEYPFPHREEGGPQDSFEWQALDYLKANPQAAFYRKERHDDRVLFRYTEALVIEPSCVACHNKLEASPKRDWRVGDVRGVVEVSQPVDSQMLMAQDGLNRMSGTLVSMGGLAMVGLALVIGRFRHINQELKIQVQEQTAELHRLANLDCLTQVANRRQFDQNLVLEWNRLRCQHLPLSLLLCDVDYFKHYNDTYGHQAGDACLQMVARTLTDVVQRSGNLVARYGGEEFVIILPNTDQAGAVHVAQAILTAIRELEIPHESSEVSASVTLSVGIATQVPSDRHLPSHMVQWADQALYQAKAQGRNGFGVQEIPPLS